MIAPVNSLSRPSHDAINAKFEEMLPRIRAMSLSAFRHINREHRYELTAEVVARAYAAFLRLAQQGKAELGYATPLALFSIKQVKSGRRMGSKLNVKDISSEYCQLNKKCAVKSLDRWDVEEGQWQEVVVEDRRSGPAEIAAVRIDFSDWLKTLTRRERKIAETLSTGETTGAAARKFGLSPSRISQLRREFKKAWEEFVGEASASEVCVAGRW